MAAAVEVGGIIAGASGLERDLLQAFGQKVGLLFQIVDDILDVEGDVTRMGKAAGGDARKGKATYSSLMGLAEARRLANQACDEAKAVLAQLPRPIPRLVELTDHLLSRTA